MPQYQLHSYRFGAKWDRNSGKISHESRKDLGELCRPLIEEPLYEGDQVVRVRDVVSDAIVDIYINNIFANSVQATDSRIEVNLPKTLSLQYRLAQGDPMEIDLIDGHT
jgi:hypothetical protein